MTKRVGIILAGGTGARVGLSIPKQLIKIAGKTVMEHTIAIFQDAETIVRQRIAARPNDFAERAILVQILIWGKKFQEADNTLLEDLPAIPLWYNQANAGWSENVKSVETGWNGEPEYYKVEKTGD